MSSLPSSERASCSLPLALKRLLTPSSISPKALSEIYGEIVPRLLKAHDLEAFRDALLDLSQAFRHIDYNIHDTGRTDL